MNLSHLLTASLACAVVSFTSGAEASPHFQAQMFSPLPVQAGFKCGLVNGQLICGDKKSKSGKTDDNDEQDDQPKNKKKSGNICEGDNHCGAGYTDLETPNKYKACCELNEGSQAAPKEAEKCKFPGEVGTPPDCTCPPGTEFMGYRGCLPKKADPVGPSPKKLVNECYTFPFIKGEQAHQAPFVDKCRDVYKGQIKCDGTFESGKLKCCCSYSQ